MVDLAAERRFTNRQRTSCHTLTTANHTSSRPFSVEVMVGILLVALLSGRMDTSVDALARSLTWSAVSDTSQNKPALKSL